MKQVLFVLYDLIGIWISLLVVSRLCMSWFQLSVIFCLYWVVCIVFVQRLQCSVQFSLVGWWLIEWNYVFQFIQFLDVELDLISGSVLSVLMDVGMLFFLMKVVEYIGNIFLLNSRMEVLFVYFLLLQCIVMLIFIWWRFVVNIWVVSCSFNDGFRCLSLGSFGSRWNCVNDVVDVSMSFCWLVFVDRWLNVFVICCIDLVMVRQSILFLFVSEIEWCR